jgi:hypothetical protein
VTEVGKLRAGIRCHRDSSTQERGWHDPQLWGLLPGEDVSGGIARETLWLSVKGFRRSSGGSLAAKRNVHFPFACLEPWMEFARPRCQTRKGIAMRGIQYLAVRVTAVAGFVVSSVWYIVFGKAARSLVADKMPEGELKC